MVEGRCGGFCNLGGLGDFVECVEVFWVGGFYFVLFVGFVGLGGGELVLCGWCWVGCGFV